MSSLPDIFKAIRFIILTLLIVIVAISSQAQDSDQSAPQNALEANQAGPLYLYYFETHDKRLHTDETQQYQFTAFQGENPTIAVYGLDQLVLPHLTVRDEDGNIVATGRSTPEQPYVSVSRFTAPRDQNYTLDVTATQADVDGGLVRVMLVEGDPIDGDLTYLDTVNPLLPGRVFMVAGSDEIDEDVSTTQRGVRVGAEVLPVDRFREKPDIFVSRGSPEELPTIEERFNPANSHVWFNEDGNKYYFFTVHAIPEQLTVATRNIEYTALNLLTFFYFDYFFVVGAGSDPVAFGQETQPCSEVVIDEREECNRVPERTESAFFEEDEDAEAADYVIPIPPAPEPLPCEGDAGIYQEYPFTEPYVQVTGSDCSDTLIATGVVPPEIESPYAYYFYGFGGDDYIEGSNGADFISGGSGWDIIYANAGDDTIAIEYVPYSYGYDYVDGGDGTDTLDFSGATLEGGLPAYCYIYASIRDGYYYSEIEYWDFYFYEYSYNNGNFSNVENLIGTNCVDYLYGDDNANELTGNDGGDYLYGLGGVDILNGDDGNDYLYGGADDDELYGGEGDDYLYGEGGDDTINGGGGNDFIYGGEGEDDLYGDAGNDTFFFFDGSEIADDDEIDGGDGVDTLDNTDVTSVVIINLDDDNDISNIENIYGGSNDDELTGDDGDNEIRGRAGNDTIDGGNGENSLHGGAGNDTFIAATGSDGENTIFGGDDNDTFIRMTLQGENDFEGGAGVDEADYSFLNPDIIFTIPGTGSDATATATDFFSDTLTNVETYTAGGGEDIFTTSGTFTTAINMNGGEDEDVFNIGGSFTTSTSNSVVIDGGSPTLTGDDVVNFQQGTTGYFTLIGIEEVFLCDADDCETELTLTANQWTTIATNLHVCFDPTSATCPTPAPTPAPIVQSAPMITLQGEAGADLWELAAASEIPADGGAGSDTYQLAEILGININDTGTSGTDTVIYAVENAALTIEALSETSYSVSSGTNTIFLNGIENITTGAANDIFLLDYDTNGVSNVFDAGENADATDRDTAIIQSDLDLTLAFAGNSVNISETGNPATIGDTLLNFEAIRSGSGNDSFIMGDGLVHGFDLDGDAGLNSILYDSTADLTLNMVDTNVMTVTDGLLTDTLSNFSSVTTGDGDDTFNLDINAASTSTAYNFNAGGGNNIFRFFFDGDNPLTNNVAMTVGADGENNILDFTGVNVAINIDLDLRTPQEIFDNFILTLEGVFEAVFNPGVQNLPTELPPVLETENTVSESSGETDAIATPTDAPAENTEEASADTVEPTESATSEAAHEPTAVPTDEPSAESTPAPETTQES